MNCPKCNSENVQRLSVIYQSGTHKINTSSTTVGGGYFSGPGIGIGSTATSGKQQSIIAKKAAPPSKRSYLPLLLLVPGFLIFRYSDGGLNALIGFILMLASVAWVYFAYRYNSGEWREKQSIWEASWHCNRCGEIYRF